MKWLDTTLTWMFPTFLLDGTPWLVEWRDNERISNVNTLRIALPVVALAWASHYLLYDLPMKLEPAADWLTLRAVGTAACLAVLPMYLQPMVKRMKFVRVPAVLAFVCIVYLQSISVVWHGQETWIFLFIMTLIFSFLLRLSSLLSGAFCLLCIGVSLPNLIAGGVTVPNIVTGSVVTLVAAMIVRTSYLLDIRNFLLAQQHEQGQRELMKLNQDFTDRLRSFIPKIIADRIEYAVQERGLSVLEASMDVLQPKDKKIACLFSDIRGFTENSKDLHQFVGNSVLPEVKACTDLIEDHLGIPRKIGDLVFAYFDDESPQLNVLRAILTGMDIARHNSDMNATAVNVNISRYILIDSGDAIVGNLGGQDSSVEITALGSPVNFLARLDEVTKHPALQDKIQPGDLLLSETAMDMICSVIKGTGVELDYRRIDLSQLGVTVRDFPDARSIYSMRSTDKNYESLVGPYNYVTTRINGTDGSRVQIPQ